MTMRNGPGLELGITGLVCCGRNITLCPKSKMADRKIPSVKIAGGIRFVNAQNFSLI